MEKKKLAFPHVYVLLLGLVILMGLLTYIVPAGVYDFIEVNGKSVIDPNSFHYIEQTPVSLWKMLLAIPQGMVKQANLIFCTFIVTGGLEILNRTGALEASIGRIAAGQKKRLWLAVPLFMIPFTIIGATGISNQIVAFVPLGLLVGFAIGGDAITGTAMVMLGMSAGFCLSPFGTSTTGNAQTIANVELFSGWQYRIVLVGILWLVTAAYIVLYTRKIQKDPTKSIVYNDPEVMTQISDVETPELTTPRLIAVLIFVAGLVFMIYKALTSSLSIDDICGIFIIIGIAAGVVNGYTPNEMARYFVKGCEKIAFGALVIGFASAISVVMTNGNIIYTIVHAIVSIIGNAPPMISAILMNICNIFVNFLILSGSGQAATVMPIMAPVADLVGLTRQTAILAFNLGDGMTNMILPTSGTLLGGLAFGKIAWSKWAKWVWKFILLETVLGFGFLAVAVLLNYS